MSLTYGWEKLYSACYDSVGSAESPQKRLAGAVAYGIIHLRRENLPTDETWERVAKLIQATTCKPAKGDEGTITATTSQMTDEEAGKWLREIMSILIEVAEAHGSRVALAYSN